MALPNRIPNVFFGITQDSKKRTQLILTFACVAVAVWTMVTMLIIQVNAFSALPYGDHWDHWRLVVNNGYTPGLFFRLHNEHRIALPRLWFMIDHFFFSATSIFLFTSIYLIQLGQGLLLWRIGARASGQSWLPSLALGSLVVAAMFSSQQFSNFTWAFEIQFVGVYLLATAALYSLMRAEGPDRAAWLGDRPSRWLILSALLAWGATYTMASGLFLWPVLLVFGLAIGFGWRQLSFLAVNGVAAWTLYLIGFHSPLQHIPLSRGLLDPPLVFTFLLTYLGSPVDDVVSAISKIFSLGGDTYRVMWASVTGFAGLFATACITLRVSERRSSFNRAQMLLLFNIFFIVFAGTATAMGRAVQFKPLEALTSRYVTPPLIFWSCILALLWSVRSRSGQNCDLIQPGARFQLTAVLVVFLLIGVNQTPRFAYVKGYNSYLGQAEAAITGRVYDEEVWKRVYYDAPAILPVVQYFWDHKLSVYHPDWIRWLGKNIREVFPNVDTHSDCVGAFDEGTLIATATWPGFLVSGWAWDPESRSGPGKVILVNEKGEIAGVAQDVFDRADVVKALPAFSDSYVGWRGYVGETNFQRLDAYLLRSDKRTVCRVGSRSFPGNPGFVRSTEAGPVYPGAARAIKGVWTRDGYYPDAGKPPVPDEIFGSWAGSDANTGTITLGPFRVLRNTSAIALPVVTGPDAKKASIQVVNRTTGDVLASISPVSEISKWVFMRLSFPALANDTDLTVVATDEGSEWGQWLAIGQPHQLLSSSLSEVHSPLPKRDLPPATGATQHLSAKKGSTLFWVDEIGATKNPYGQGSVTVPSGGALTGWGWAVDQQAQTTAGGVDIAIDDVPYAATYGIDRPDVADGHHIPGYRSSGWRFSLPIAAFKGRHTLTLRIVTSDRKAYYETPPLTLIVM